MIVRDKLNASTNWLNVYRFFLVLHLQLVEEVVSHIFCVANIKKDKVHLVEMPQLCQPCNQPQTVLFLFCPQQLSNIILNSWPIMCFLRRFKCLNVFMIRDATLFAPFFTMHMLTYSSIWVFVSMIDHSKVIYSHWTIVVSAARLLRIEYGQRHILPVTTTKV